MKNTAVKLLESLGISVDTFRKFVSKSSTRKGPGRAHVEGNPAANHPEYPLYGNKMARKAHRQHLARKHLGIVMKPQ